MRLDVQEQAKLPFKRLLSICLDSVRYRLLRSLVTVFIIVVAIAFLATILIEGELGRAARDTVLTKTSHLTAYSRFLREVSQVPSTEQLVIQLAEARPGTSSYANLKRWSKLDDTGMQAAIARSQQARVYLGFFDRVPLGRRVLLVEQSDGLGIFDWLQEAEQLARFEQAIAPMKSLRLPEGMEAFKSFLVAWPETRQQLRAIRQGCREAQQQVETYCGEAGIRALLSQAAADGTAEKTLTELGQHWSIADAEVSYIINGISYQTELAWAVSYLNTPGIRRGWNNQFDETFGPVRALVATARTPSRLEWITEVLAREETAEGFNNERFLMVGQQAANRQRLMDAEQTLRAVYGIGEEKKTQAYWLVFVSFLVCVVGIANAMLMSVLERFKEIATMKCLGARNETIAFLFITESLIMGMVGGSVGILGGTLIALVRQSLSYGSLIFSDFPAAAIGQGLLVCMGCSVLLTAFAAMYPARVASRMPPMEAMRVD